MSKDKKSRKDSYSCFGLGAYEDIRNHALIACYLATGRRFQEILNLNLPDLNVVSGEFTVTAKGSDI